MFNRLKWQTVFSLLLVFTIQVVAEEQIDYVSQLGIKNLKQPSAGIWVSGQPSQQQIKRLGQTEMVHVINLRPDTETDWQESHLLEAQGIQYHHLPIAGAKGVTFENAQRLDQLLTSLKGESILLHCASGNRVGGLIALQALVEGESNQLAIAKGKAWGLTQLETRVRTLAAAREDQDACELRNC